MLRKESEIKWTSIAMQSFERIKKVVAEALVLARPKFSKYFIIFYFASKHTVAGVLLQKNDDNLKHPIAFYKKTLRDAPLRYNILEKKVYALVQAVKEFMIYILHSHTNAFVPSNMVKDILTQPDLEGKRGKWIAVLLEYDLEIRPTKLVKGQGLAKLMTQ